MRKVFCMFVLLCGLVAVGCQSKPAVQDKPPKSPCCEHCPGAPYCDCGCGEHKK